jgi:two-component system LytT family sensor kinase
MMQSNIVMLVHMTGFTTGIVLYGMLAVMMLRVRFSRAARSPVAISSMWRDRIPVATAFLGLIWNIGALVIYGDQDFGAGIPAPLFVAIAFAALGFLPAVVVDAAAGNASRWARWLTRAAYTLSATGAAIQLYGAIVRGVAPSRAGLLLLTVGYGVVVAILAVAMRRQRGGRGPLAVVALAAFAVMALHLSHQESGQPSVWIELVGHHASLPLALVILYQDYRFAFADLFLKRALALVALVSLTLAAYLLVIVPHVLPRLTANASDAWGTAALLALWTTVAALYPTIHAALSRFVDHVVLRRVDYARLRRDVSAHLITLDTPELVLDKTCSMLGPALSARSVTWCVTDPQPVVGGLTAADDAPNGRERTGTTISVPTAEAPAYWIDIGPLTSGRRMLSDDSALADAVALAAARRIDVLRVTRERQERALRERDLQRLTTEAELRALRAQLNPHFLFNALTTIGYLVQASPERALETLFKLTALLRAVLRRSSGEFVTVADEIDIVEAYLSIERARFEERLVIRIDVDESLHSLRIPPLLLLPLVENAVKHGIAPCKEGGQVTVSACAHNGAAGSGLRLHLTVSDTGAGAASTVMARRRLAGIGLSNLERRLDHYFGTDASLSIQSAEGHGTRVELVLPAGTMPLSAQIGTDTGRTAHVVTS